MKWLSTLGLLVWVVAWVLVLPAFAQTPHYCDTNPPANATANEGAVLLRWCHSLRDTNGNATVISDWALYANNLRTGLTGVTTSGTPSPSGAIEYRAIVGFPRGNYTLQVAAVNAAGEGGRSNPFDLGVVAPASAPTAPFKLSAGSNP